MTSSELFEDLRLQIAEKRAVIVCGTGVSRATTGREIASWEPLLRHGIERCQELGRLDRPQLDEIRRLLDARELTSVGERIHDALGAGEYRRWLADTIGKLRVRTSALITAIADLQAPIITTNYDGLIEEVTGLRTINWTDDRVIPFLRGEEPGVLHVHGFWEDAASVIFGSGSYDQLLEDGRVQEDLKALLLTRSLVFIGYGEGLDDPNFSLLREWMCRRLEASPARNYLLFRRDAGTAKPRYVKERIEPVEYGRSFDDLAPFVRRLRPSGPRAGFRVPEPRTEFIGRRDELETVEGCLRDKRLITLTGPGGSGKTRLAVEAARRRRDEHSEPVYQVELEPVADPVSKLAKALGVGERPGEPLLDTVTASIGDHPLLLLLENCEVMVGSSDTAVVELVTRLLDTCPKVKILATSQAPLDLDGEQRIPVPPLALPKRPPPPTVAKLTASDAVKLFIACVRRKWPDWQVNNDTAPAAADICYNLDGIPLAIELAAAQSDTLGLGEIARQIQESLLPIDGVAHHGAGAPRERHRTLRAAIDWSYRLLDETERADLRNAAVFVGGFTLAAFQAVVADGGRPAQARLAALAHRSLVATTPTGSQMRYSTLRPIRAYGLELLLASPDAAERFGRHAQHYVDVAMAEAERLRSGDQQAALEELDAEEDNIRAALDWSSDESNESTELGARLAASMSWYWAIRSRYNEGFAWLTRALTAPDLPDRLRAEALVGAGRLAWRMGDPGRAEGYFSEALDGTASRGDDVLKGLALTGLGLIDRQAGRVADARERFVAALEVARGTGDVEAEANVLHNLGNLELEQDHLDAAEARYQEALHMGAGAEGLADAVDPKTIGHLHMWLGYIELDRERVDEAKDHLTKALDTLTSIGDVLGVATCLECLAGLAFAAGDVERAVRSTGAATELKKVAGANPAPFPPLLRERWLNRAAAEAGQLADPLAEEGREIARKGLDAAAAYARKALPKS